jgi:hypothetical protein
MKVIFYKFLSFNLSFFIILNIILLQIYSMYFQLKNMIFLDKNFSNSNKFMKVFFYLSLIKNEFELKLN